MPGFFCGPSRPELFLFDDDQLDAAILFHVFVGAAFFRFLAALR
jgi:hypothetical protein